MLLIVLMLKKNVWLGIEVANKMQPGILKLHLTLHPLERSTSYCKVVVKWLNDEFLMWLLLPAFQQQEGAKTAPVW